MAVQNPEILELLNQQSKSGPAQETSPLVKFKAKIDKNQNSKGQDFEDHEDVDVDNFQDNKDDSQSVSSGGSDTSRGSTTKKLIKIEKEIQNSKDLTKRQKRLLQNRKSALKCRLKKQNQLEKLQEQIEKVNVESRALKEKVSALDALLVCKTQENESINKKYNDLQF